MNEDERQAFNARNIAEFRRTGGSVASFGGAPLLLLTTVGSRSGRLRTSPMMYLADDGDPDVVYVFASAAGSDRDPGWLGNLDARPDDVLVEIGDERIVAHAEILPEPRRRAVFDLQASRYPSFARFEQMTSRTIPVVALTLDRTT